MNKNKLLQNLLHTNRGNLFSIEIPKATEMDQKMIEEWIIELEREGKIKLRELVQQESSIYLHGILKYASD
ncbi:hypothetical protein [Peribacillus loiseleuriae]|uniref:Uncharacterized protein n=1 Tax=Peribacillus loiseleuriae TaxID=1679170 RepID=A0A0K9G8L3_9BACI|nr:hypothetical protein [Peribacillus loiseleuriae]KMY42761.1 hypothetical protein AC625_24210 [Peribacillus loiseleuriae]